MSEKKPYPEKHPSYGLASLARVNSSGTTLFGSTVCHHNFIAFELQAGKVERHLHREWYHPQETLARIYMTEAQFAQLITSFNSGSTPVTVAFVQGDEKHRPTPPPPMPAALKMFKAEANEHIGNISKTANKAQQLLDKMLQGDVKINKTNLVQLKEEIVMLQQALKANTEFLLTQLHEEMETVVSKAVTEFEAHMNKSLAARGLESMKDAPSLLPQKD